MADTQDEIEQREQLIAVMMEQVRTGEKGIDAQIKLYLEQTKVGKTLSEMGKAANKAVSGFKDSAKAMGTSTGNFGDLTSAVTGTIGAISGLLSAIPVVGSAFAALGDAAAETAAFAIGQVQANYDSFKELAKAGQIGSEGVMGMANQFKEAGLPLQTYTKLLSSNSEQLAYFSGSALKGGRDFTSMISNMDGDTKQYMRNLGYSIDEIGESAIEWQVLQRQRGIRQKLTDAEMTKGTANYVSELDALSKLTGQNVKELKAQRDQVRSDSRFRARLMKLNAEGETEGAKNMELFAAMMKKAAPEIGQGFMDITSGAINTEAAMKLTRSGLLDTAQAVQKGLESGAIDQSQALEMMRDAAKESSAVGGAMQGLAGFIDNGTGPFLDLAKTATFGNMAIAKMTELVNEQNKVRAKPDPTTDKLSTSMANLEKTIATVNQFFIATPAATATIDAFAGAMKKTVEFISDEFLSEDEVRQKGQPTAVSEKFNEVIGRTEEENKAKVAELMAKQKAQATATLKQSQDRFKKPTAPLATAASSQETANLASPSSKVKPVGSAPLAAATDKVTTPVDYNAQIEATKEELDQKTKEREAFKASAAASNGFSDAEFQKSTDMLNQMKEIASHLRDLKATANQQRIAAEKAVAAINRQ